jgi:hypothetical protein
MKGWPIYLAALILSGCATVPLSHDQCNATKFPTAHEHEQCLRAATDYEQEQHEREDRILHYRDVWEFCQAAYAHSNVKMRSRHSHDKYTVSGRTHTNEEIRDDILVNNCLQYWNVWQKRINNR